LKILFSTLEDLSKPGAERTHVLEIARNFTRDGHKLVVLCRDGEYALSKLHENLVGIKISLPSLRVLPYFLNRKFQQYHLKRVIMRIIDRIHPDVIYERSNAFNTATALGKERGIPTFLELNGVPSLEARMQGADPQTVARIEEQTLKKLRMPDKIVAVAEGIKEHFVRLGITKEKFLVVTNGVNVEIFKPMNAFKCRKILGLPNSPLMTFVGAFRVYQGLEYAIKAIPHILDCFPDAKLVLVGDSEVKNGFKFTPTRQDLEAIAAELGVSKHLYFTGFVPQERVVLYINASDVCIAPLIPIGSAGRSPLVLFEYMACGKPVVTSTMRDIDEIARKSEGILTAKPADPRDLSSKIVTLLKDSEKRSVMGEQALQYVRNNHDWRMISKTILNEMEKIVSTDVYSKGRKT